MSDPGSIRVLHVDDEPAFTDLVSIYLEREDDRIDVVSAESARAALARMDQTDVDCIVSDYQFPGDEGLGTGEFLETIHEEDPPLPFILFTGKGPEVLTDEMTPAEVTEYIKKGGGTEQFRILADRIGRAVEMARTKRDLKHRLRQQEVIADLGQRALTATDLDDLFEAAARDTADALDTDHVGVLKWLPERGELLLRAGVGWRDGAVGSATVGDDRDSLAGAPLTTDRPVVVEDLPADDRIAGPALFADHDVAGGISVVIGDPDDPWGVFGAHTTEPTAFSEHDVAFVQSVAAQLASAIDRHDQETALREEKDRFQAVAESAKDGIVTIDESSTIRFANPAVGRLFGYEPEELEGEPLTTIIPERLRDRHSDALERYLETGRRRLDWTGVEFPGLRADGQEIDLSISFSEFSEDGDRFFTGVLHDITERKAREAELERKNERLDRFASMVSHDLRNPLNILAGQIDFLREEVDAEQLDVAERAIARMDVLLDDLLTVAREGEAGIDLEPVTLSGVVEDAWEQVQTVSATLEIDGDVELLADRSRLQRLFENLIRNAVDHGGEDVLVSVGELADGVFFEDDGVGIPESDRDAVFESGYSTADHGTGFGLEIVRRIAEGHGWEVSLTEGRNGGARFEFTGVEVP